GGMFTLSLRYGTVTEGWRNLAPAQGAPGRDPLAVLNDLNAGSRLVTASNQAVAPVPPAPPPTLAATGWLGRSGGADGLDTLTPEHFASLEHNWGLSTLDVIDEVAMVVAPDLWARPVLVGQQATPRPPQCRDLCVPATGPMP